MTPPTMAPTLLLGCQSDMLGIEVVLEESDGAVIDAIKLDVEERDKRVDEDDDDDEGHVLVAELCVAVDPGEATVGAANKCTVAGPCAQAR